MTTHGPEDPPTPYEAVSFTVSEGTWMNVDVSPDGKEIAFDLMGDIYVLPVEGGADGDFRAEVNSLDDARSHLRRLQAVGAFSVKSYNQPRRDQRQQILEAAREMEMMVYPEGGSTFFHNINMIQDGHTGIEHNLPVAPLYDDMYRLWEHTTVGYTPTLVVSYGGYRGERSFYHHSNVWENERLLRFVPRQRVDPRARRRTIVPEE